MYTLRTRYPSVQTAGLALLLLVTFVGLGELAARADFIESRLPTRIIGIGHDDIEVKIDRLRTLTEAGDPINCFLLGPSQLKHGVDPEVLRRSYKRRTGKELRCFNFGVGGMYMPVGKAFARILIEAYRPELLILAMVPSAEFQGRSVERRLEDNPWARYRLGEPNINGWLIEHSYLYGYYLRLRLWTEQPSADVSLRSVEAQTSRYGYVPARTVLKDINETPDPREASETLQRYSNFEISPRHLAALDDIIRLQSEEELLLVEMPVHPTFMVYFGRGEGDRERVLAEVSKRAEREDLLFLTTSHLGLIPDNGFRSRRHLNERGARIFSRWLGEQIGDAVRQGRISSPMKAGPLRAEDSRP